MPAYCFFDILKIKDETKMAIYREQVFNTVAKYEGKYLVIGGNAEVMEGNWQPTFPVLIEFPNLDQAQRWYNSEEYKTLKDLRLSAVDSNAFFVQGF
jgi:uncharacterized protein (DUF1330 family)